MVIYIFFESEGVGFRSVYMNASDMNVCILASDGNSCMPTDV
jgi:hypothetical protein